VKTLVKRRVLVAVAKVAATRPAVEIQPYDGPAANYIQLTGVPLTMAILNDEYKELMSPVMCKDYITDAFWSEHSKKPISIYGFNWTSGTIDPSKVVYRIGLKFGNDDDAQKTTNVIDLINLWDKALGFKPSQLLKTNDIKNRVLEVDRAWTEQPIRISLLTLMLRMGTAYTPGEGLEAFLNNTKTNINTGKKGLRALIHSGDGMHVAQAQNLILKIYKEGKFPAQTYAQYKSHSEIHNRSGIVSMAGSSK